MTLLNGILAFGALAFTVPLAIHLLFRTRFRTIDWGAMHLLDSVMRVNHRRIQLLHLLLLLMRCLLPVLLAFCLARPVLTGFQSLPGDAPQSLVIAIDDSRSMSARDASGLTRMDRARQGLTDLLQGLSRRDEVLLVRSSQVGSPAATQGAQEAIGSVRSIRAENGPVDLAALMRGAIEAVDNASHPQRRILVVGDFPSNVVDDAAMSSLTRLATALNEQPIRPVISFWNLGNDSNELDNVSVDAVEVDSPAVVAGRLASFSATLRNASDLPMRDLRVVWSIDGAELTPTPITIAPRSSATARLSHRIDSVGVHQLTVAIEHGDALIEDNRRSIAVDVIREIRVALVDGHPSSRPLEGDTDYLALALSPFAFGGEDQPDAVRTSILRPSQIEQAVNQQTLDVLVLANVDRVQGEARKSLARFVLGGGALVVFDGDHLDINSYNEAWACDEGTWFLPTRLDAFVGSSADKNTSPLPIGGRNSIYSPWDALGQSDQEPFVDVELYGYRKLSTDVAEGPNDERADEDRAEANASISGDELPITLWSMANGDPLAVSARRGRGRVVQFAIPCDTDWSTLPLRLVYLPMMQQLMLDLAGSRMEMTVDIGKGFSVPISELAANIPEGAKVDEEQAASYWLEAPGEAETELRPTDEASPHLSVARATSPGTYRVRKATPMVDASPIITSTMRLVEVPAIESQLRSADPSRLSAAAGLVEANVYTDIDSLQSDDRTRRFGREIWRWLLVALLIFLVAELLLEQVSVKSSKTAVQLGAT